MSAQSNLYLDSPVRRAIEQIKAAITNRYPRAIFELVRGEDPEGIYLRTTVDLDDVDQVLDGILDELYEIQVEQALPVYVIPLQPLDRVLMELSCRRQGAQPRTNLGSERFPTVNE